MGIPSRCWCFSTKLLCVGFCNVQFASVFLTSLPIPLRSWQNKIVANTNDKAVLNHRNLLRIPMADYPKVRKFQKEIMESFVFHKIKECFSILFAPASKKDFDILHTCIRVIRENSTYFRLPLAFQMPRQKLGNFLLLFLLKVRDTEISI